MLRNMLAKDLAIFLVCAAAAFAQPPQETPKPPAPAAQSKEDKEKKVIDREQLSLIHI